MDAKYALKEFDQMAEANFVYVRPVRVIDLPEELRDQLGNRETVYEISKPDGEQLALVGDRDTAFVLAREHDYAPVTLH